MRTLNRMLHRLPTLGTMLIGTSEVGVARFVINTSSLFARGMVGEARVCCYCAWILPLCVGSVTPWLVKHVCCYCAASWMRAHVYICPPLVVAATPNLLVMFLASLRFDDVTDRAQAASSSSRNQPTIKQRNRGAISVGGWATSKPRGISMRTVTTSKPTGIIQDK
jgi:hypothetical protein